MTLQNWKAHIALYLIVCEFNLTRIDTIKNKHALNKIIIKYEAAAVDLEDQFCIRGKGTVLNDNWTQIWERALLNSWVNEGQREGKINLVLNIKLTF